MHIAAEFLGEQPPSKENNDALITALGQALKFDTHDNDAVLAILNALAKQKNKEANDAIKTALDAKDHLIRRRAASLLKANGVGDYSERIGTVQTRNTEADYRRAIARIGKKPTATMITSKGRFTIEFIPEEAPLTVDNFLQLANKGYFNGQTVPRVVPNFVVQAGDPRGELIAQLPAFEACVAVVDSDTSSPQPFEERPGASSFVLAFRALPLILVVSALSALLFYWRILPAIVRAISAVLEKTMGVGGAVGLSAAANIFVGMVEAPLVVRPYLAAMSRGELFIVMACGMAGVAAQPADDVDAQLGIGGDHRPQGQPGDHREDRRGDLVRAHGVARVVVAGSGGVLGDLLGGDRPYHRVVDLGADVEVQRHVPRSVTSGSAPYLLLATCYLLRAGSTVPSQRPNPTRPPPSCRHQPVMTTVSPSSRNLRSEPSGSETGLCPFSVSSIRLPWLPGPEPDTVPEAYRSPGRAVAPFMVTWASCWAMVQYIPAKPVLVTTMGSIPRRCISADRRATSSSRSIPQSPDACR